MIVMEIKIENHIKKFNRGKLPDWWV
jgi:hypothetical protein